jgi:hypothetical protein
MDPSQFWIKFVLGALATWRLAHLLVREDGPADIIARLRALLSVWGIGGLLDCFGCLSIVIAFPVAFFVSMRPLEVFVIWLALSGAAFLLERISPEPVIIERIHEAETGASTDGMLRPETPDPEQRIAEKRIGDQAGQRPADGA